MYITCNNSVVTEPFKVTSCMKFRPYQSSGSRLRPACSKTHAVSFIVSLRTGCHSGWRLSLQ